MLKKLMNQTLKKHVKDCDGILVPGGFGHRATKGKIAAITYARKNNIPFFGICYGHATCSHRVCSKCVKFSRCELN